MHQFTLQLENNSDQNPCTFRFRLEQPLILNEGKWGVALTSFHRNYDIVTSSPIFVTLDIVELSVCGDDLLDVVRCVDSSRREIYFTEDQLVYIPCECVVKQQLYLRIVDERGSTVRLSRAKRRNAMRGRSRVTFSFIQQPDSVRQQTEDTRYTDSDSNSESST